MKTKITILTLTLLWAGFVFGQKIPGVTTRYVPCGTATPCYSTIQGAIDAANTGDDILVSSGTYNENIIVNKKLTISAGFSKEKVVVGAIIYGNGNGTVVSVTANEVILDGFIVQNSGEQKTPVVYAGIHISADNVKVENTTVSDNDVGIRIEGDNNEISNCIIENNNTGVFIAFGSKTTGHYGNKINQNSIVNNVDWGLVDENGSKVSLFNDATCNWWDTSVASEIESKINGTVLFLPFWTTSAGPCDGLGPVVVYEGSTTNIRNSYMKIQDAINASTTVTSDVIKVSDAIYDLSSSVTINKKITLTGNLTTPSNVVINAPVAGGAQHSQNSAIVILSSDVTVQGFKIQGAHHTGTAQNAGIYVDDPRFLANPGLNNISILNNEITDNGYGIVLQNVRNSLIKGNKVFSSKKFVGKEPESGVGIIVYGRSENSSTHTYNLILEENLVYENETEGIRVDVDSKVGSTKWENDLDIVIKNNKVYYNGSTIGGFDKYIGIKSSGWSKGVTLVGNEIYNHKGLTISSTSGNAAIQIFPSRNWIIEKNIIRDNLNGIIFGYSTFDPGSGFHYLAENDIYGNIRGISIDDGSEAVLWYNNIYSNNSQEFSSVDFLPYGIINSSAVDLEAINNWWGDISGPYHETTNPDAEGNGVTDKVIYSPWLGLEPDPQSTEPMTFVVDETGSIQAAIDAASDGDIIKILGGTYSGDVNAIQKQLTFMVGSSPGCATVTGTYTLNFDDVLEVEIEGATVCTEYDQLTVQGQITLGDASLDLKLGYAPLPQTVFAIIQNQSGNDVIGEFAQGNSVSADYFDGTVTTTYSFKILYNYGASKDVVLISKGRIFHFDATQITGLSDGEMVSQWNDISGLGYHASQATNNNKPVYKTNALNGKPVVRFSIANPITNSDFLQTSNLNITTQSTVFIIAMANVPSGNATDNETLFSTASADIAKHWQVGVQNNAKNYRFVARRDVLGDNPILENYTKEWNPPHASFITITNDGSKTYVYINGVLEKEYTGFSETAFREMRIGRGLTTSNRYFNGDVAEIVGYNYYLNETDRKVQECQLVEKWLITKGGDLTPTAATICSGNDVILTLNNYYGTVDKWQSSTDGIIWNDISHTSASLTVSPTVTTSYRAVVKIGECDAVNSASATITIDSTPPSATSKNSTVYIQPDGSCTIQNSDVLVLPLEALATVVSITPGQVTCAQLGSTVSVEVVVADSCNNQTTVYANLTVQEGTNLGDWQTCITHASAGGNATYSPCTNNGTFQLSATGQSTTTQDVHRFVYKPMGNVGTVIARLADVTNGGYAGVMIRESCAHNAKAIYFKTLLYNPNVLIGYRTTTGKAMRNLSQVFQLIRWMKIQRNGSNFKVFVSYNGTKWQLCYNGTISMNSTVYAGIFVESVRSTRTAVAYFDHVEVADYLKSDDLITINETGQENNKETDVVIFPNPTDDRITILYPYNGHPVKLTISDPEGRQVITEMIRESETQLDVHSLRPGIWFLRFESDESVVVKKLIIQ